MSNRQANIAFLLSAIDSNSIDILEEAIKFQKNVCCYDEFRRTPIYKAVSKAYPNIVETLIKYGAKVNEHYDNHKTLLHVAMQLHNIRDVSNTIRVLIHHELDIDSKDFDGRTPLHEAVFLQNYDLVECVLSYEANPSTTDRNRKTPLHYAVTLDNVDIAEILIEKILEVDFPGGYNDITPLFCAVEAKKLQMVKLLLENRANLQHVDKNGETALHCCARSSSGEIAYTLIEGNMNLTKDLINLENFDGQTPLHLAVQSQRKDVVIALLSNRAEVSVFDKFGKTPLHYAAELQNQGIVLSLLAYDGNVHEMTKIKDTTLELANRATKRDKGMIRMLVGYMLLMKGRKSFRMHDCDDEIVNAHKEWHESLKKELKRMSMDLVVKSPNRVSVLDFVQQPENAVNWLYRHAGLRDRLLSKNYDELYPSYSDVIYYYLKRAFDVFAKRFSRETGSDTEDELIENMNRVNVWGPQDWVKCTNATINEALQKGGTMIAAIVISSSKIGHVPANAFFTQSKSLSSINLHNCGIRDIDSRAFAGLSHLKKLSLPNNNITELRAAWFDSLLSLEQLDLSFNKIRIIDAAVFNKLTNLQRLNLNENQIECLQPRDLEAMRGLAKIRIESNHLTFQCRAKITRWFVDRGINYKGELDKRESTLDSILWHCSYDDPVISESELLMKECVLLNLYNQLQSALATSDSYPTVSGECVNEKNVVAHCIKRSGKTPITNGQAVRYFLSALNK